MSTVVGIVEAIHSITDPWSTTGKGEVTLQTVRLCWLCWVLTWNSSVHWSEVESMGKFQYVMQ